MSKVCIIGIDGGTYDVIDYLVKKGRLPNFSSMMQNGSRATLYSTTPALTPAAWTTFYTGTNPGSHGAIEFFKKKPGAYSLTPVNGGMVQGLPIWTQASRQGKRVCVYNVPMTYPAAEVNGILISGMDAPKFDDKAVYPDSFMEPLLEAIPDFDIEPTTNVPRLVNRSADPVNRYIAELRKYLDLQIRTIRYLTGLEEWDLFVGVFRSPDAFSHAFWREVEKVMHEPAAVSAEEVLKAEAVFSCYEAIDSEIGDISDTWKDHNLVMMSDHGFGSLHKEVCLNRVLAKAGLLAFRKKTLKHRIKERVLGSALLVPPRARSLIKRFLRINRQAVFMDLYIEDIDWELTSVYALSQFGTLYMNDRNGNPNGTVAEGRAWEEVIAETEKVMMSLVDPEDGLPVVNEFHRCEELFSGGLSHEMPAAVVVMRNGSYRGVFGTCAELSAKPVIRTPYPDWGILAPTGCHRREGMLLLHGKDVTGEDQEPANMVDVAPTVLRLMHLPVPSQYEGEALGSVIGAGEPAPDSREAEPGQDEAASLQRAAYSYSDDDEEEIRKRLADLGYI
ncbi:MAG: alkaline phosphatase family protein [Actinobacteria bacterium]|nr:alkaline phosphatase family protein [Actinomycetota bacterium]MCL5883277.1 alkaline phosphatase family protein [Actinomycetota bacterium]